MYMCLEMRSIVYKYRSTNFYGLIYKCKGWGILSQQKGRLWRYDRDILIILRMNFLTWFRINI